MRKIAKILSSILLSALMIFSAIGCSAKTETTTVTNTTTVTKTTTTTITNTPAPAFPLTVTDQLGRKVTLDAPATRLATCYYISSSACIALGLEDCIVAAEEKIEKRPIYKLAAPQLIGKIGNTGSAKAFDLEACIASKPDLVILPKKAKDYIPSLEDLGIKVIVVVPENHEDICGMFELIGKVTGHDAEAAKLIKTYNDNLAKVESLTNKISDADKPVVYMCNNSTYLSTAPKDMYQGSLIKSAGGKNAGDILDGDSWTNVSYEQLLSMNPDIIVIPTNNMADGQPSFSADEILADPQLAEITAVKNKAVYNMPVGYEAWDSPVPSGSLGLLWMTALLHPEVYTMEQFADDAYNFYKEFYGFDFDKSVVTGK